MRKPDSFVVYPGERYDSENGQYWMLQGNNRVAKIYENGKCRLSKRVNGHPTFMYLNLDAFQLEVSSEIVNEFLGCKKLCCFLRWQGGSRTHDA